jgi:hypothetical protein
VYVIDWCAPSILWEARRLWHLFDAQANGFPKFVTQHWRNWCRFVSPFTESFLVLRAAFNPRSTVPQHYLRACDQACVATAGLLLILGQRYLCGRPFASRKLVPSILDAFLKPAFAGEGIDISIALDCDYLPVIFRPLSFSDIDIPVDDGMVTIDALIAEHNPLKPSFSNALAQYSRHADGSGRIPIGAFFLMIFQMGYTSITIQVCSQIANIVDAYVRASGTKNPLNIPEDTPSFKLKGRGDRTLLDKLVLGEGVGDDGKRATFSGHHIRSYQMFLVQDSPFLKKHR